MAARPRPRWPAPRSPRSAPWCAAAGRTCCPVASERHTAFAAESVADEIVFVTGPALVTFLATSFAPQAGLVAALLVGTVGALGPRRAAPDRAAGPSTRPEHDARADALGSARAADLRSPSRSGACSAASRWRPSPSPTTTARKALSGLMLGAFSLGSLIAGFVAGTIVWRRGPLERVRIGTGAARGGHPLAALPARARGRDRRAVHHRPGAGTDPDHAVLADRGLGAAVATQRGDGLRTDRDERRHRPGCLVRRGGRRRVGRLGGVLGVHGLCRARRAGRPLRPRLRADRWRATSLRGMATWTNWSGLSTAHPTQEVSPHDAGEVVDAVVAARHQNLTVKMPGTGHSFTDIARHRRADAAARQPARHPRGRRGRDDRHRAGRYDARASSTARSRSSG